MISQIEQAVVDRIKAKLAAVASRIDVQRGVDDIRQPGIYASAESGRFSKVSNATWKHELDVWVDMVFSHVGGTKERRQGVSAILEGVLMHLFLEDLGLSIEPLKPALWKNTTPDELRETGQIVFSLRLQTSYTISRSNNDEAADELLRIGLNYYLQPGDDQSDATDLVTLASN